MENNNETVNTENINSNNDLQNVYSNIDNDIERLEKEKQ